MTINRERIITAFVMITLSVFIIYMIIYLHSIVAGVDSSIITVPENIAEAAAADNINPTKYSRQQLIDKIGEGSASKAVDNIIGMYELDTMKSVYNRYYFIKYALTAIPRTHIIHGWKPIYISEEARMMLAKSVALAHTNEIEVYTKKRIRLMLIQIERKLQYQKMNFKSPTANYIRQFNTELNTVMNYRRQQRNSMYTSMNTFENQMMSVRF